MGKNILLFILGFEFTATWALCIFFVNRTDSANIEIRREISEIRKEITELHYCVKDHHARLSVIEKGNK